MLCQIEVRFGPCDAGPLGESSITPSRAPANFATIEA